MKLLKVEMELFAVYGNVWEESGFKSAIVCFLWSAR